MDDTYEKFKYALHPGWITSKNDGDKHYINAVKLMLLYHMRPNEFIVWTEFYDRHSNWSDYIHLFPSYQGNYGRPENLG